MKRRIKILVACEFSGVVREALNAYSGVDAMSCDLEPAEDGRDDYHHQGDVLKILDDGWDAMIGFPPCTYILNSGCKHLYKNAKRFLPDGSENPRNPDRWRKMEAGARFFRRLLNARIPLRAIENPIMVGHAKKIVGRGPDQVIQPWQFGHGETKATCLWLEGLPPLVPTNIVDGREPRIHFMSPGKNRSKERSRTFPGIAEAMVEQWLPVIWASVN